MHRASTFHGGSRRNVLVCAFFIVIGGIFGGSGLAHAAGGRPAAMYVAAGGPVVGATITLDGIRQKLHSDRHGFLAIRLPRKQRRVHVISTGGRVDGVRIRGSLHAVAASGGREDVVVNPISTIVSAYLVRRPRTSKAVALARVRKLLGLEERDDVGRGLLLRQHYFDGVKFVRYANAHGRIKNVVSWLVDRIDERAGPVTFRGTSSEAMSCPTAAASRGVIRRLSLGDTASYVQQTLGMAGGIANVFGYSSFTKGLTAATDILTWAGVFHSKPAPSETDEIYASVEQIQDQLTAMKGQIAGLQESLDCDFNVMEDLELQVEYKLAVEDLANLQGIVQTAEDDFTSILDNATSIDPVTGNPGFHSDLYDAKINDFMAIGAVSPVVQVEEMFNAQHDVFADALKADSQSPYFLLGDTLTDAVTGSHGFATPDTSTALDAWRNNVLYWQARAFELIVAYEVRQINCGAEAALPTCDVQANNDVSDDASLMDSVHQYLGSNDDDVRTWLSSLVPGTAPTSPPVATPVAPSTTAVPGDLQTELSYLESIADVPAGTVIAPPSNGASTMWTPTPTYLGTIADNGVSAYPLPNDTPCEMGSLYSAAFCDNLAAALAGEQQNAQDAAAAVGEATGYMSGWRPADYSVLYNLFQSDLFRTPTSSSQISSIFPLPSGLSGTTIDKLEYWDGTVWCRSSGVSQEFAAAWYICPRTDFHQDVVGGLFPIDGAWIPVYQAGATTNSGGCGRGLCGANLGGNFPNLLGCLIAVDGRTSQGDGCPVPSPLYTFPYRPVPSSEHYLPY